MNYFINIAQVACIRQVEKSLCTCDSKYVSRIIVCSKCLLIPHCNHMRQYWRANYFSVEKSRQYCSFAAKPNSIFRDYTVDAYTSKMSVSMATFHISGINSGHPKGIWRVAMKYRSTSFSPEYRVPIPYHPKQMKRTSVEAFNH